MFKFFLWILGFLGKIIYTVTWGVGKVVDGFIQRISFFVGFSQKHLNSYKLNKEFDRRVKKERKMNDEI